jgi:DNA-directed RNA polymerase specialized sigma24 family protein
MTDGERRREIVADLLARPFYKGFARRFCRPQDVDEALQRTALICLTRIQLREDEAERYFTTVLRNECFGILRREKRHLHIAIGSDAEYRSLEPDDPRQDPAAICEYRDELGNLTELKAAERQAISDLAAGLSYGEIQSKHGWTYTKVNRHISEGRASLRAMEAVC